MVAAYLGIEKPEKKQVSSLEDIGQFVPSATVSKEEFNALLSEYGLLTEQDQV